MRAAGGTHQRTRIVATSWSSTLSPAVSPLIPGWCGSGVTRSPCSAVGVADCQRWAVGKPRETEARL